MTEDHKTSLAVHEVRVRDLMALCDKRKLEIINLENRLAEKDVQLNDKLQEIEELKAKCDNMLTARAVYMNDGDMKSARLRLSKLVREVDKCIALLNE